MGGRISYLGGIVKDGLVLDLDAAKIQSYPRTGTLWTDVSGNGYVGTLTNGPTFNSDNGGSIVFDGSNNYVTLNYTIPSTNTVIIWFNQTTLSNRGILETTNGGTQSPVPYLYIQANNGTLRTYNYQGSPEYSDISAYLANTWYCLSITRTPTLETTYLNGVVKLSNKSLTYNTRPIINIGVGFAGYFNGRISQTLIYNRTLSATEVLQNYNATRGRFGL